MNPGITILSALKVRYIRLRLLETLLLTLTVTSLVYAIAYVARLNATLQLTLALTSGLIAFLIRFFLLKLNTIRESVIAKFLDRTYPQLYASSDLILVDRETLPPLARIQQRNTIQKLESLSPAVRFPNQIKIWSVLSLIAIATCTGIVLNEVTLPSLNASQPVFDQSTETIIPEKLPAELKAAVVTVRPPAYTGIRPYAATDLNLTVQENSRVTWSLTFSNTIKQATCVSASGDTLSFTKGDSDTWLLSTTLDRNGFYQLVWKDDSVHTSDYYKIEVVADQSPVLKITELDQFTQVTYNTRLAVDANATLVDDYGLTDAYIIATVSKGSGESVKFREEKIRFASPARIGGKQVTARQTLDLKKLGLEPGDELYFYVEAIDNKTPVANRARTETYFITIPDTAQDVMVADGGLGVDLMPEYFRSQRQIIIDTEKLIREKKAITKKEFGSRSNELGYDQKVLRLRYGQFLGEEAESGIAHTDERDAHSDEQDHDENKKAADMVKEFGHQHDTENEHNLVEEKDLTRRDVDGGKKENLLKGFIHEHDNEESATFFYQSIKLKLKAALAQMWDAELYLRLYEPEKSLPYQYTALKLLKEISNDSRIYVHRTGFEPPPIKEEKRLSANLTEISSSVRNYDALINAYFPHIVKALRVTENLQHRPEKKLSNLEKAILVQSGSELAQAALENPALLPGLSALKKITSSDVADANDVLTLQNSYWRALPKRPASADQHDATLHILDQQLIQNLLRAP